MCSMVASSPILAVQLAERALTACNYSQNHLLALFVDVIGSATCAGHFLQIPCGFLYVPVVAYSELPAGIASLVQYPPLPIHSLYLPTWNKVAIIVAVWLSSSVDAIFAAGQASLDRCILTTKNELYLDTQK